MVRAGEVYKEGDIEIHIVEVIPYRKLSGRRELLIGYFIKDGNFKSPVAHFWMDEHDDIRKHLRKIVAFYNDVKNTLKMMMR